MRKFGITLGAAALVAAFALAGNKSGLDKGESVTPFHPKHFAGPLANTSKCFPCTFQSRPQVQVWVNGDSMTNVEKIAGALDAAMAKYTKQEFKALIVFVADASKVDASTKMLAKEMSGKNLKNVSMAVIANNDEAVKNYKINLSGDVKNTVFVYKDWKVQNKMVNLDAGKDGTKNLLSAIESVLK